MVLAISMAILWAGGCQEEQASSGEKMARLTALENKDLQAQLQAEKKKCGDDMSKAQAKSQTEIKKREDEIKNLDAQLAAEQKNRNDEVQDLKKQLDECGKIKSAEMQKASDKEVWDIVTDLTQKNAELIAEVDRLKAELAKTKDEEKK
jgi:uncharacterized small protein (DUF1192 family)